MAHDSRCADADTAVESCDCECDGRLHGIGNENSDHQTAQIMEHEQRIEQEFSKRFSNDEFRDLKQEADFEAWEQLREEKPELAEMLQKAEDDPNLDFEVGDIYWEKNANGDRMNVIVPGIDNAENIDNGRQEELLDAAGELMQRKKAKEYEKQENRLRELNMVTTDGDEFPEMDHIRTSIEEGESDPYEPTERLYDAEHRFGDLYVKRRYRKSEDGDKLLVDTKYINGGNYDFENQSQDIVDQYQTKHPMPDSDDLEKVVKANHNGDPQEEFRTFGD